MLKFTQILPAEDKNPDDITDTLTLTMDQRVKSRLKVTLDNGQQAGLFLPRGSVLQQDDLLKAESGEIVVVQAADESVSTIRVDDAISLAKACYHLGNRHVPLQISSGFIRYQHDHVLDDMVRGLGLTVKSEQAPFEPEPGAYGGHGSSHSHDHESHNHDHEKPHSHAH